MNALETYFARRARRLQFSQRQQSLILGSLLGDAGLAPTSAGYCFRVHHGLRQAPVLSLEVLTTESLRAYTAETQRGRRYRKYLYQHPVFLRA